jgi:hypothetical protein
MRSMLFVLAALVASGPTAAQSWEEYAYSEYAVSLTFPANPQIEMTSYQVAEGRSVPARVYSVRQDKMVFNLTIADLAGTNLEESALIDNAIKMLSTGRELTLNLPHRIYRVYGRQFVVEGRDGSTSMAAVFDYKRRLYLIEAKALPGGITAETEFALARFQQSLTFTDGGSNRTEDQIRAYREACPRSLGGGRNAAGMPFNPAGADDPRCQVQ